MEKRPLYIVTGAGGHLGSVIVQLLEGRGEEVRGLILPEEWAVPAPGVTYIRGDLCQPKSLLPLFEGTEGRAVRVIHTAGIVDITGEMPPRMWQVNVGGTRTLLEMCAQYRPERLVYVSSVHAIPEGDPDRVLRETARFSPKWVRGGYAKSKAEATRLVLQAAEKGLPAVVVHPSGIIGPYGNSNSQLVRMIAEYMQGKLRVCVPGGYDLVDVRDVAAGCVAAADRGRAGECYILSNRHYEIRDVLRMVRRIQGGGPLPILVPQWAARAALPFVRALADMRGRQPLYTPYALYTLGSNDRFSHDKAARELGYAPRDLMETLRDTVAWVENSGVF